MNSARRKRQARSWSRPAKHRRRRLDGVIGRRRRDGRQPLGLQMSTVGPHFQKDRARQQAKEAMRAYESALREKFFGFA
jgi:hypothetical protein